MRRGTGEGQTWLRRHVNVELCQMAKAIRDIVSALACGKRSARRTRRVGVESTQFSDDTEWPMWPFVMIHWDAACENREKVLFFTDTGA